MLDEYPAIPSDYDISGCSDDSFDDESWNPESWQIRGIPPGNSSQKNQVGSQGDPPGASSYVPEPPARVAKFPVRVGGDQEDKEDEPILDADSKQKWNILDRVTIWFLAAPPPTLKKPSFNLYIIPYKIRCYH